MWNESQQNCTSLYCIQINNKYTRFNKNVTFLLAMNTGMSYDEYMCMIELK